MSFTCKGSPFLLQHTSPHPYSYIFSIWNKPFAPADDRTAIAIVSDVSHPYHHDSGVNHLRKAMLKSWRQVDEVTREED